MCGCLSHASYWGPDRQPRHVPWLGIEPVILWFAGPHSIHWAIPARAGIYLYNDPFYPIKEDHCFIIRKYILTVYLTLFLQSWNYCSILFLIVRQPEFWPILVWLKFTILTILSKWSFSSSVAAHRATEFDNVYWAPILLRTLCWGLQGRERWRRHSPSPSSQSSGHICIWVGAHELGQVYIWPDRRWNIFPTILFRNPLLR